MKGVSRIIKISNVICMTTGLILIRVRTAEVNFLNEDMIVEVVIAI